MVAADFLKCAIHSTDRELTSWRKTFNCVEACTQKGRRSGAMAQPQARFPIDGRKRPTGARKKKSVSVVMLLNNGGIQCGHLRISPKIRSILCWWFFPIGLRFFSLICDLIDISVATTGVSFTVALYIMVGGLIGALAAAVPRLIDSHMTINLTIVVLYAVNIWLRTSGQESMKVPVFLSMIGVCMIAVSGYGACLRRRRRRAGITVCCSARPT